MKNAIIEYGQIIITVVVLGLVCAMILSGTGLLSAFGDAANGTAPNELYIVDSREAPVLNVTVNKVSINTSDNIRISENGCAIDTDFYTLQALSKFNIDIIDGANAPKNLTDTITVKCDNDFYWYDADTDTGWIDVSKKGDCKLTFTVIESSDGKSDDVYYVSTTKTIILTIL